MGANQEDTIPDAWLSSLDSTYLASALSMTDTLCSEEDRQSFVQEMQRLEKATFSQAGPIHSQETDRMFEYEHRERSATKEDLQTFYRMQGYLYADTNPLQPSLAIPEHYRDRAGRELWHKMYSGTITLEAGTLKSEERDWCFSAYEKIVQQPINTDTDLNAFHRLIAAEGLERYLGSKFPGAKRFSLEGLESFNILLEQIIEHATTQYKIRDVELGLSHRGRLNVLVNILGKQSLQLFEEFEGTSRIENISGDVKYHQGFSNDFWIGEQPLHVSMAFNPSHLESVGAVICGSARARQDHLKEKALSILPIMTHGDSAFSGQGIVMELMNMSLTRGYNTQGTIHIVMDNQIGFTTSNKEDTRSTTSCTDIAKMMGIPVIHVNAQDPQKMLWAAVFAVQWRFTFKKDCIIHLIGYRKHGHNEADEPAATQPLMYQRIRNQPSIATLCENALIAAGTITKEQAQQCKEDYRLKLEHGDCLAPWPINSSPTAMFQWAPHLAPVLQAKQPMMSVPGTLANIGMKIVQSAQSSALHTRVAKIYEDRSKMFGSECALDWGAAEILAFGAIVDQGISIRLSGQDSKRGTFFQRHCYVVDQNTGEYLNTLEGFKGEFYGIDSLLSEEAVLGFEYGYSTTNPNTMVIWEAQFGDFANGAQAIIDQFISSGEQKWGQYSGLTMLLPHGYEGQGPEHSSARIERYLQLASQNNIKICYPSTPAQYFHLLWAQIFEPQRHPLIVFTPKSLLRHPQAVSSMEQCSRGKFRAVIADPERTQKIKRLVFCSGKIYFEFKSHQEKNQNHETMLVRIEQLYPFPTKEVEKILKEHQFVLDLRWGQEEPKNQGAWHFIQRNFAQLLNSHQTLRYCGREEAASTATGWHSQHIAEQKTLIESVFE